MEQRSCRVPGPHFKTHAPGDSFSFTHPVSGTKYTLTVQELERQTISEKRFGSDRWFYPTHFTAMSYTLSPEPDSDISICDCAEGDKPLEIAPCSDRYAPEARNDMACIGIIGGADGPTAIFLATRIASELLGPIAVAAYSYMALIPLIQPPIMRLLTTKKEREVKMEQLRKVSKTEKIIFPIIVTVICVLLIPDVAPLIGMLMLGNLFRESGVTDRLNDTAQNALCNIVTIMLGVSVGATANGATFLKVQTLAIVGLGLVAFAFSTAGGVLLGKLMFYITKGKVNPLIGAAGVSAVPMAARVAQKEGRKANPTNFLLMHAMGPNVAGVIGSAVAAGFMLLLFQAK